jgi:glycosyltransferase involved in cell wall biosynthesis
MRVAVVTPYYKEELSFLVQCHQSVLAQDIDADHIMVADGFPREEISDWRVKHVRLPVAHGDNGNTPRAVGSLLADAEGYDFIAYLDADNWFHPGHLKSLLALHTESGAPVCTSFRTYHSADGTPLPVSERSENEVQHVDTSCYLVHRSAFSLVQTWARMPRPLSPICDRVFFAAIANGRFRLASTRKRSVAFRSQYLSHYRAAGLPPPASAKGPTEFNPAYVYLASIDGIAACVDRLGFWPSTLMPRRSNAPG